MMESKTLLKNARARLLHIRVRQEDIDALRSTLLPSAVRYDKEKVQASPDGDSLSDTLGLITEIEAELDRERNAAAKAVKEAAALINRLEEPELRELLRLRYISCKSWAQIAVEMNYSERTLYRMHGDALKKADDILTGT